MTAILTHTRFGPMLVPPYDMYLSQAMIRNREYAPDEFETWLPYLPDGGVVLDVGANFGAHTFAFAHAVGLRGTVLAIEPQRMLYYMLCGSIALGGYTTVHAKHCAAGAVSGTVRIPPIDYGAAGNFGGLELENVTEGEPVPCITIDDLKLERLDFVKIDVEGMEPKVLTGARQTLRRCRPVLSVEADRQDNVATILEKLREWNYVPYWHKPLLGELWPNVVSINLLALPEEKALPEPDGDVEPVVRPQLVHSGS